MGEAAARIHSRAAIDESLEVASDCLVVDVRNVDVEAIARMCCEFSAAPSSCALVCGFDSRSIS